MKRRMGYTVVELLVVLALLAVLASVAMPFADVVRQRERERELQRALWSIREALDAYKAASDLQANVPGRTESGYPPSLQALVQGLPDVKAPGGRRLFLREVPRDPFAPQELPAHETWRLRSYASEADRPLPGADVYDVRSMSDKRGLNGLPLSQW